MTCKMNKKLEKESDRAFFRWKRLWEFISKYWILRTLLILIAITFIILMVRMVWGYEPMWIDYLLGTTKHGDKTKWETIYMLGKALSALVLAFGIYATYRKTSEGSVPEQKETTKAQHRTAQAQRDANEQKTFNDAITNLGNKESDSIRVGGAYGLYELAKLKTDRLKNITEILCAHLRLTTQNKTYQENYRNRPSEEVQSLLDILSELNRFIEQQDDAKLKSIRLNLRNSYLIGANLIDKHLKYAILSNASLQSAHLSRAQMQGANLVYAQMLGVYLNEAQMQETDLSRAQMQGTILNGAQMQGASLCATQMLGATLRDINMQGAFLAYADFKKANLEGARLQGACLLGTDCRGANLVAVNFQGVYSSSLVEIDQAMYIQPSSKIFKDCIRQRIGKDADLKGVILGGGLSEENTKRIIKSIKEITNNKQISKEKANEIIKNLEEHKNRPPAHSLPETNEAHTGSYTAKEADEMIAAYDKAMDEK